MISFGVLLVILGVGSLALPYLSPGLALTDILNPYQPWAGVIVSALGLITVLFGAQRRGRREATEALAAAAPAAPAESAPASGPAPAAPSAVERAGEPTMTASTTPPTSTAPSSDPWPTEPPERSDD
jgi:hypothetical protein